MINYTWHILLVALAGWMNRQQQEVIEYLKEENRILREKLGPGRVLLNVAQKRRLASAAFKVGRKLLQDCATLFSPDSGLCLYRLAPQARSASSSKTVLRVCYTDSLTFWSKYRWILPASTCITPASSRGHFGRIRPTDLRGLRYTVLQISCREMVEVIILQNFPARELLFQISA